MKTNQRIVSFKNSNQPFNIKRAFHHWCSLRGVSNPTINTFATWAEYNSEYFFGLKESDLSEAIVLIWNCKV